MKNKWCVTRQYYYYSSRFMVEIAYGGMNYTNADALVTKYPGEFEEYLDPLEAVEAAISIHQQWKKDMPNKEIYIGYGCTGGDSMEFDGELGNEKEYNKLREWANEKKKTLPKCDYCGQIITTDEHYINDFTGEKYCSEYCAESDYNSQLEPE